jgi:hypothetical protein
MPADARSRSEALEWPFAVLKSVGMASLSWSILVFSDDTDDTPAWKRLNESLVARLQHTEPVWAGRQWLAGSFSGADRLMADVLRLMDRLDRLAGLPCWRYGAPVFREGARGSDGTFCGGGLSSGANRSVRRVDFVAKSSDNQVCDSTRGVK